MPTQERLKQEADLQAKITNLFRRANGDPDLAADLVEKELGESLEEYHWEGLLTVFLWLWMQDEEAAKSIPAESSVELEKKYGEFVKDSAAKHSKSLADQLRETNRSTINKAREAFRRELEAKGDARKKKEEAAKSKGSEGAKSGNKNEARKDADPPAPKESDAPKEDPKPKPEAPPAESKPEGKDHSEPDIEDKGYPEDWDNIQGEHPAIEAANKKLLDEIRAHAIAVTEITRALSISENVAAALALEMGYMLKSHWITEEDDRVCPECSPLHNMTESAWSLKFPEGPPAHVFCRCRRRWVITHVRDKKNKKVWHVHG